jgi:hypothetical protein
VVQATTVKAVHVTAVRANDDEGGAGGDAGDVKKKRNVEGCVQRTKEKVKDEKIKCVCV